jgi:hypothetical protein
MRRTPAKKSSLARLVILSVIGICVVVAAIFVIKGFVQRKWDRETRFTVISFTPDVVIKSFDRDAKQGIILRLPKDLQIESILGRGNWRAEVIDEAGDLQWAAESIAEYLGITYTAIEKDLEWWDKLMWTTNAKDIAWREIDLAKTSYVEKKKLPDGMEVLTLSSNWDQKAREWFYDQNIASQALGVELINTTTAAGLGASAARVVESMGFKVRSLSSISEKVEKCLVKSNSELKNNVAVRKLLKTFNCRWETSQTQDVFLVLGTEYLQWKQGD